MTQIRMTPNSDVLIIGAGPVGLTLANLLGQQGVDVLLVEKGDELIDYPRAVGIDDEALRAMQTADIVDEVLPHTIPDQKIYMVNGDRLILSEVNPTTREFGWPRRNGFVQPLVDRVLLGGSRTFRERHGALRHRSHRPRRGGGRRARHARRRREGAGTLGRRC